MKQTICAADFTSRFGFLNQVARRLVDHYSEVYSERKIVGVNDLRKLAEDKEISPADLFRFRGCGNHRQPGKIVLFCFPSLKSAAEQRAEKVEAEFGSGI